MNIITLDDYLRYLNTDIASIIMQIGNIGVILSDKMRHLPIEKMRHLPIEKMRHLPIEKMVESNNIHGEIQTSLDVYANNLFREHLLALKCIGAIVSEEDDNITQNIYGSYSVAYDPIDGSSNIDLNIPVGSIFGIYDNINPLKGNIIAAGYILYGASTMYIIAINNVVKIFTLTDKWVLTDNNIKIPQSGINYSINEGNEKYWNTEMQRYIQKIKEMGKSSLRYVGSMVADIHRTLLVGGVFIYPSDLKNPNGKLRQLYEVNPMSYIIETAGGISYCNMDKVRCLDVPIIDIHQKCPIFIGSSTNIDQAINIMNS